MKKYFKKNKKGFTLVETLFAILFLSLALVALLSTITQGSADARYVKDKTTALYLAAEGLELATNQRDSYCAGHGCASSSTEFYNFSGMFTICGPDEATGPGCAIAVDDQTATALTVNDCNTFTCGVLALADTTGGSGMFNYSSTGGSESHFDRRIYASQISPGNGQDLNMLHVVCIVNWTEGSISHSISLSTDLFNRPL